MENNIVAEADKVSGVHHMAMVSFYGRIGTKDIWGLVCAGSEER